MQTTKKKNYVTTFVLYSATRALMQANGFDFQNQFETTSDQEAYQEKYDQMYNECLKSLYSGGYQIYTSINLKHQSVLQKAVNEALSGFTDKNAEGTYLMQGSAVSIDNETGRVVAIVGGRSQDAAGYTLNRAFQSFRQPGSSIKPLIVYTPAFENGYTPESYMSDAKFEGGPRNSDGVYLGNISLRKAVAKSKNTIAWKLFEEITPTIGLSYLKAMNYQKIVASDYVPAVSLGGFTVGTSALEMASGFATLENDGIYREPTCIVKITDAEGNMIVEDDIKEKTVYTQNASRMMVSALQSVMTEGTGTSLRLANMTSAGKTGTTNDKKDGWFVGFTPYYTTSVWVGYDTPTTVSDLYGSTYPGTIWKTYMEWANEGLEDVGFKTYKGEKTEPQKQEKEEVPKEEEKETEKEEEKELIEEEPQEKEETTEKEPEDKNPATVSPQPSKDTTVEDNQEDNSEDFGEEEIPDDKPAGNGDEVPPEEKPEEPVPEEGTDGGTENLE